MQEQLALQEFSKTNEVPYACGLVLVRLARGCGLRILNGEGFSRRQFEFSKVLKDKEI